MHSADVVYVISGGLDKTNLPPLTYEVIGVNVATKEVFAPSDIPHAVYAPGASASLGRLVVCGGLQSNGHSKHCQLYSQKDDRYAALNECILGGFHSGNILVTASVLYKPSVQPLVITISYNPHYTTNVWQLF